MSKINHNIDPEDVDTLVRCLIQAKQTIEKMQSDFNARPKPSDDKIVRFDFIGERQLTDLHSSVRTAHRDAMNALIDLGFDIQFEIRKPS